MTLRTAWVCLLALCSCDAPSPPRVDETRPRLQASDNVSTVAFGSCLDPARPHPIVRDITAARPDAVVLLGDNVYADAGSEAELRRAYDALGQSPAYRALAAAVPVLAVWDDHDYGRNDAGKEYELKEVSKRIMLDFFAEPPDSPRRTRAGNYDAVVVGPTGQRVQFLLLDTRWFRDPLDAGGVNRRYVPHETAGPTMLGEAQWAWLEAQLRKPADVRLLITSVQLVNAEHGFESWGLFPAERRRLFDLLASTRAAGVVAVSGDRHRGELSCVYDEALGYPLFELTASALNRSGGEAEESRFRWQDTQAVRDENFGLLRLDWAARTVTLELRGRGGVPALQTTVALDGLRPGHGNASSPACAPYERSEG